MKTLFKSGMLAVFALTAISSTAFAADLKDEDYNLFIEGCNGTDFNLEFDSQVEMNNFSERVLNIADNAQLDFEMDTQNTINLGALGAQCESTTVVLEILEAFEQHELNADMHSTSDGTIKLNSNTTLEERNLARNVYQHKGTLKWADDAFFLEKSDGEMIWVEFDSEFHSDLPLVNSDLTVSGTLSENGWLMIDDAILEDVRSDSYNPWDDMVEDNMR